MQLARCARYEAASLTLLVVERAAIAVDQGLDPLRKLLVRFGADFITVARFRLFYEITSGTASAAEVRVPLCYGSALRANLHPTHASPSFPLAGMIVGASSMSDNHTHQ